MSYRSFKRVLGETSLERKCRFLFGACLLLLITASFWWYGRNTEAIVVQQNRRKGELFVDNIMLTVHWLNWNSDPPDAKKTDKIGHKTVEEYETIAQWIRSRLRGHKYDWKFLQPRNEEGSGQPSDAFERDVLEYFKKAPSPHASKQQAGDDDDRDTKEHYTDDGREYHYYQPVYAEKGCVECHKTTTGPDDLAEGDLMAVAKVIISNEATRRDRNWNRALLLATAIITVFLAMIAAYVIVRYVIVKPLQHLRDVSDAVSHGNLDQRAEIHTADEFEELGVSFNRMLRHLVTAQEELRRVNGSLDLKVDELAQANMRLFELNRLKGDFLATMSHELRTPLNSIIGFSDVLGSIKSLDEKQRRYVQNIQKSGKMLLDMINDILDLAKIESGKMELRPVDFRIEQVIATQCDMARPLTEKKNIDLETEIESRLPELHQDQAKVQQILNNLLSNAIKFTPEGGRISIAARRNDAGDLLLVVSDTGVGIAEADQTRIFEKFRQGHTVMPGGDAMTREYSGTGLGLSIVKELCKLLGGEITLQSELGKGSIFTVRLPMRLADPVKLDPALTEALEDLTKPRREDFALHVR